MIGANYDTIYNNIIGGLSMKRIDCEKAKTVLLAWKGVARD